MRWRNIMNQKSKLWVLVEQCEFARSWQKDLNLKDCNFWLVDGKDGSVLSQRDVRKLYIISISKYPESEKTANQSVNAVTKSTEPNHEGRAPHNQQTLSMVHHGEISWSCSYLWTYGVKFSANTGRRIHKKPWNTTVKHRALRQYKCRIWRGRKLFKTKLWLEKGKLDITGAVNVISAVHVLLRGRTVYPSWRRKPA